MPSEQLINMIRVNLENAAINGYTFEGWSVEAIAEDLNRYCPDCEGISNEKLVKALEKIRIPNVNTNND